ncbi:unnamed protein product, partial [Polarella glacialis]
MSWLSDALQKVQSRGSDLKEKVREQASKLAARDGGVAGFLQGEQGSRGTATWLQAQEAEARVEAEARRLAQAGPATEVLERWLSLLRAPQRRYVDAPTVDSRRRAGGGAAARPRELTFRQVFLRSRALELAVDAAAQAPELRAALRSHALAAPEAWPDSCPPAMAFSRAFVALLWTTIGPTEVWLGLLGILLSSEKAPGSANDGEEPCHSWLLQLLASRRLGWEAADAQERESEIWALEEAAKSSLDGLQEVEGPSEASSSVGGQSRLLELLSALTQRGSATAKAQRAWELRAGLAEDLARAAVSEAQREENACSAAAAVALAAAARAETFQAAAGQAALAHAQRTELGQRAEDLRERLQVLAPETQRLQTEIQAAEERQQELLMHMKENKELLDGLKKRRAETRKQEGYLTSDLLRADGVYASKLADEDESKQRAE